MYEIISLFGEPYNQPHVRRERTPSFSFKRVGKALLLVFGVVAVAALVGWFAYGNNLLDVVSGKMAVVTPKAIIALLHH